MELSKSCLNDKVVICDLMLFVDPQNDITESFIERLKTKTNVYSVLIYCPINQLLSNVTTRNSSPGDTDRRSPISASGQYLDMYFPTTGDTDNLEEGCKVAPDNGIDPIEPAEWTDGIDALSTCEIQPYEEQERQLHIDRLRQLSQRPSSPVFIKPNIYNLVLKNLGHNFEKNTGLLFYNIFKWLEKLKPFS